ncbi:MAG: hypothetical protein RSD49_06600 [Hafnia sp.]
MFYATLIRRYLFPHIGYSVLAALLMLVCVWNLEGFIPALSIMVFFSVVIFCIPLMVFLDYREVKSHVHSLNDIRKGGAIPGDYIEKTVALAAEKTGMPEFVVSYFVRKVLSVTKLKSS